MGGAACQHSQGPVSWSTVPWGASASWAGSAGALPLQRSCCGCLGMPAAGGAGALCSLQGRLHRVGRAPHSLPAFGTGLTSSPGPWPVALTSQQPVSHMQPYLLAWSCLQGLITSSQSTLWCSAASSSHAALQREQAQELLQPEQAGQGGQIWWLNVSGYIGSCPKEPSPWGSPSSSHSRPSPKCPERFHGPALPWQKCPPSSAAPQVHAT